MKPSADSRHDFVQGLTRRHFLGASGLGGMALAGLLDPKLFASRTVTGALPGLPHFAPTAKHVIYLHQSGAPSQIELFDYKPNLKKVHGTELPSSIRNGQRITGMTSGQDSFPVAAPIFDFKRYGKSGVMLSELLPYTGGVVDDLCIIKTAYTEAINHDPAITFIQTGSQIPGRPSFGSWVNYGLGSENENLPAFVVMLSQTSGLNVDQPLFSRLWSSGFLPSNYQGVLFRAGADPVLYLSDPPGIDRSTRRAMLDALDTLNHVESKRSGDPEVEARIGQYEMAFRMQASVPELMDLSKEPDSVFEMYGPDARKPGTYASQCLIARRLVERGVRFVQLYKRGWDQHGDLPRDLPMQTAAVDQPSAALITDLKRRGLLDETLVIWGGEFGRTIYCQGRLTPTNYGRDHHPRAFTVWMAGGGIKPGLVIGQTDDYCYNVVEDPVHVHDIQATILHCLGVDHKRLTYRYSGRDFRLTDVAGEVVTKILR
jgi:hypothetical protein